MTLLTHDEKNITQKFFEEVAVQVRRALSTPTAMPKSGCARSWRRWKPRCASIKCSSSVRLESIKRIHQATDTLKRWIAELETVEETMLRQIASLEAIVQGSLLAR